MSELAAAKGIQRPHLGIDGDDHVLDGGHPDEHPDNGDDLVTDQRPMATPMTPYAAMTTNPADDDLPEAVAVNVNVAVLGADQRELSGTARRASQR